MAEILLINPSEITETTILGGNIDLDKYRFCIFDAQIKVIQPLLGDTLYEYIKTNKNTLSGLYLELYNDYIKPIIKFSSVANYINIASYIIDNGGVYKHQATAKELATNEEIGNLVQRYNSLADMYIQRFYKWICLNSIPEYLSDSDNIVNPNKELSTKFGWYL